MIKRFIILIVLTSFQFSYAQEDGSFKEFFEDGQFKTEGQYKNKKKDGVWKSYHPNGQLSKVYTYVDGKRSREYTAFFKDGKMSGETKKINNEYLTKEYYEDGTIFYERILPDGFYKEYLENGDLKIESNYVDGELSGIWKQYYNAGELEWIVHYKNGYREGDYQNFYTNGQIKLEGRFRKDKKDGVEKRYLKNGQLVWTGNYKADKLHKKWVQYDAAGKVLETLKFDHGRALTSGATALLTPTMVPEGALEKVPVYPGCENKLSNRDLSRCMSDKLSQFVRTKFNPNVALGLGLNQTQRILVKFEINKNGKAVNGKARGSHPVLEREAVWVIDLLPKMQPGIQRGKPIVVPYSFPIVFNPGEKKSNR
ncbi:energy transducer TonB [Gelidibacter maritimus]|uniref:Energy transducer TonB n=1 Tax=Gelidibacter maritimus TaxID=2761487 RepID=A0A7W2M400_9FLAO|nr:energy transducer TonB [Gelidibacter maritimus]MBA6152281.1 energy transducer TonB [Gelidibacter maritimus]